MTLLLIPAAGSVGSSGRVLAASNRSGNGALQVRRASQGIGDGFRRGKDVESAFVGCWDAGAGDAVCPSAAGGVQRVG